MNRSSTPSPERAVPPTPRGQRTRQRLLQAAEAVFGEKGYEHASIADITREGGVALGTFYVYFPDKKSLFVEVVDGLGERLRRLIAESVEGLEDRLEVEREGLRAFFRFANEHRNLYRIVRQAEFVDEACYRRYYVTFARGYAQGLKQAMAAGQVRRLEPETLAWCLMGIGDYLGMRWVLWEGEQGQERVLDTAMDFIRHGMDGRPAVAEPDSKRRKPRRARAPRSETR
ncbi:MAG TPA: TetR/AcrR family transcriptional regulator [Myxococcaceae bacterium]|nr:TetR/AcrR family transcriptional regulator [Myxococcaceae bacterium]